MMRAFENRPDAAVWDEPFYAYYLRTTGLAHPGAARIIAAGEVDWREVATRLVGEVPDDKRVYYQKHMTHHLLPDIDRGWMKHVESCFLIRDPREVIASYARTRGEPTLADIGIRQQVEIFEYVWETTGRRPPVLDSQDVLSNPREQLMLLCCECGIPFVERMLVWPSGRRDSDGVWAEYWYDSVIQSTGFTPFEPKAHRIPKSLIPLAVKCERDYQRLYEHRLGA